jgi:cytoskeletal protein CcmA (bactofilin family)
VDGELSSALKTGAAFTGPVHVLAPARLEGRIEGEITAVARLWIGPGAKIQGCVRAPEIIVEGRFEGELRATDRIELRSTARVAADVFAPSLVLQEGAILQGQCTVDASTEP